MDMVLNLSHWVSRQAQEELAVVLVGRVTHHLMQAGSIQIA
jgi:hypothetical protein